MAKGSMRIDTTVQVALVLVLTVSSASALTIDNFEEGPFSVSDLLNGESSSTQGGLSPLNVISGRRTVVAQSSGSIATTAELALSPGDDAANLAGDPSPPGALISGFRFEYRFDSPFDLTQGGSLDRFLVDITAASGTPEFRFNVLSADGSVIFVTPPVSIGGVGAIAVPFGDFFQAVGPPTVLDLSRIDEIRMIGQVYGSFSVSSIAAVPGPATGLLLGTGFLALLARVRRRAASATGG